MIIQIYKILSFGGFLLIKDFDIVSEDQKYLHNTFYDLYRTICDGVPIEHVLENKKIFLYLSSIQYIELFSQFGFEIVAKNTPAPTRWVFNDSYLLFIKMKH
jgi:arginine utilization protein RocB